MKPKLYLINGPLGAGKTTLLKYLLQDKDFKRSRVIENEFANISIDTEQLHDHTEEVTTIAGVCICCSTGDELTNALTLLSTSSAPVIIEATGVANSLKLVEKLILADMLDMYEIAQAIFVLDAVEAIATPKTTLEVYKDELLAADTVILTKTDLLSDREVQSLVRTLGLLGIDHLACATEGRVDTKIFNHRSEIVSFYSQFDDEMINHDAYTDYTVIDMEGVVCNVSDLKVLWAKLQINYRLRRLKGDVRDIHKVLWHVEATPGQCRVTASVSQKAQLVLIGQDARLLTHETFSIGMA